MTPARHRRRELRPLPWLALITVVAGGLRLWQLGDQPLWLDEAYSLSYARLPLAALWDTGAPVDMHPPLYYSLLHAWIAVAGTSETALRLPSVLLGLPVVWLTYAAGRLVAGAAVGLVGSAVVATSPFLVRFAQEARMYALLLLLAAGCAWCVAWLVTRDAGGRRAWPVWAAYGSSAGLALLTHTSAVFLVAACAAVLLLSPRIRRRDALVAWVGAHALAVALWALWVPGLLRQAAAPGGISWLGAPSWTAIVTAVGLPFTAGGEPPGLVLAWLLVVLASAVVLGSRALPSTAARTWLFGLWLLAPAAAWTVGLWRPVFLDRTLLWIGVPLSVLTAAAVVRGRPRAAAAVLAVAIAGLHVAGLRTWFADYEKEAWDRAAAIVAADVRPDDVILYSGPAMRLPFEYYFGDQDPPRRVEVPAAPTPRQVTALAGDDARVWLVYSHAASGDPEGVVPRTLAEDRRERVDERLTGVRILRFDP